MDPIKNFCNTKETKYLLDLEEPLHIKKSIFLFDMYKLVIPKPFKLNLLEHKSNFNWKQQSFELRTTTTNYHSYITLKNGKKTIIGDICIDFEWLKKQNKILRTTATPRQLLTLYSYTNEGSKITNAYLFGKEKECINYVDNAYNYSIKEGEYFPLFFDLLNIINITKSYDDILIKVTKKLKNSIDLIKLILDHDNCYKHKYPILLDIYKYLQKHIILKAVDQYINMIYYYIKDLPTTSNDMVLYRGVKTRVVNGQKGNTIIFPNFTSTSLDFYSAINFGGDERVPGETNCCFKAIVVPKDSHVFAAFLVSEYPEFEILINKNSEFEILKSPEVGLLKEKEILDSEEYKINLCTYTKEYEFAILKLI